MQSEYVMDALDAKLNEVFDGKVVRKDLLHRIKKGTNVPTFVLEFLLARYCASDEPAEIQAGMEAVLATLQENYVRPDEANAAQSRVAMVGKHKFIDKVHVRYVEKEKRHWASLENFASQRIAIGEKYYRDNDRLLEGGIWAEAVIDTVEGRDEKGIKKTVSAFLKVLHPADQPTDEEFEEYVAYAVECRRRVKEQMNKRKPDDEFARIDLSYIDANGKEIVVYCPESRTATATLE